MQVVIEIPEQDYIYIAKKHCLPSCDDRTLRNNFYEMLVNGTPLSEIIDSLKELSKDHRHNYSHLSHEERAWRLGIEDSIDLLLTETGVEK